MDTRRAEIVDPPAMAEEPEQQQNEPPHSDSEWEERGAPPEAMESETKEAIQYWGPLFNKNRSGTEKLNRLLEGIAVHIVRFFTRSVTGRLVADCMEG